MSPKRNQMTLRFDKNILIGKTEEEAYSIMAQFAKCNGYPLSIHISNRDNVQYEINFGNNPLIFVVSILNKIITDVRMITNS